MLKTNSEVVTAREIAHRYGVAVTTVLGWVRRGRIPCLRPSRRVMRFVVSDVDQAIKARGVSDAK